MTRAKPPNRRGGTTIGVRYADLSGLSLKAFVTYNQDPTGKIVEVFIVASKPGSAAEAAMRDAGILLSMMLQMGASLQDIGAALTRNDDGSPAGPVGIVVDALLKEVA